MALCFQPSSQNASTLIAKRPFKKIFSWPACKQGVSMFHLVSSVPCDRKRAVCFSSLMSSPSWPPHQSRMALSAKPPSSRPVQTARSPPTPALAKARAAPGTTGGVEPALSRPWPPYSSNNCLSVFQRFAKPQRPHPSKPSAGLSKATVAATRPSHLFLRAFKTAVCPPSNPSNPSAGLSKATLAATWHSHMFFRTFKTAVYPPSNLSNPSASLSKATLAATRPSHLFLRAFKTAVFPPSNPSNPSACLSKATLAATRPSNLFLRAFKTAACPPSNPSNLQTFPPAFPRQLSQLHAPAIYF